MRAADDTRPTDPADLLDAWLPDPTVRTHHRRSADADPDALWHAATTLRLTDTRTLGRLVRWRIPGLERDLTYGELFRAYPFTVLEEGEHTCSPGCAGGSGRSPATTRASTGPRRSPSGPSPAPCACCSATGSRRPTDGAELVSEARVQPTDRTAALRLRALWKVIGPFERLVGAEAIGVAAARA